jgi:thiol-disulfide isomerase/thioredoxin
MEGQIERVLPFVAAWGAWMFAALCAAALLGMWRLGRGRWLLVPARWPARLGSLGLLALAMVFGTGLYGVLGPMRPMLDQVRYITGTVGKPAGDLAFRQVADDAPRRLGELHGQVVLVNLWATWCPPCRKELPAIDKLQKAYASRGLVVVTLSDEERDRLRKFAAEHPLSTLNVYAPKLGWLDVGGRPLSMVIDRNGTVRECLIGGRSYAEFEAKVKKYLAS